MKKNNIQKDTIKSILKDELTEKQKQKYYNLSLLRGYSFSDHSHGRVNHHSIGFNHEPGTL